MKIINLDKKQYLSPEAFGNEPTLEGIAQSQDGVMQGLLVLCADGNNRGGGDLRSDEAIIGSWVGDRIAIVSSTACSPELSEPGLEDIPLLEQVVKEGEDVSEQVIAAIVAAEGIYSGLCGLPREVALRPTYRSLFGTGMAKLAPDNLGKSYAPGSLEELLEALGLDQEETVRLTFTKMAERLNLLAETFAVAVRWQLAGFPHEYKAAGKQCYQAAFVSNEGALVEVKFNFATRKLTMASFLKTFGLSKVLEPYQSKLPKAVADIVNKTLAGKALKEDI